MARTNKIKIKHTNYNIVHLTLVLFVAYSWSYFWTNLYAIT